MSQGARASGMGLAFTAVADDPSAIFYNPAGMGWQKHFEVQVGGSFLTKVKGDFSGANPNPGDGISENEHKTTFTLPTLYAVVPLTSEINFGLGIFAPYGLGFRWDNAEKFSGRFVAQNAVIQSTDVNPVISFQATPQIALAVGADYRFSKVMLEKNQAVNNPFTSSLMDAAHVKLNTTLTDNHGWGWNAGILLRPVPQLSIGAAYRSKIKVDYSGDATFEQRKTGNPVLDALVFSRLPQGKQNVATSIEFPASVNLGAAIILPSAFTVALEADYTKWTSFNELLITFPQNSAIPPLDRHTDWNNSWAYRIGLEKKFSKFALRAGYYRDKTPQPVEDAGPILADADRDAFTAGLGYDTDRWGVNLGDIYIKFKDRDTRGHSNDSFFGVYKESANVFALDFRLSF
jgi:long-chain fatty acid transport protein